MESRHGDWNRRARPVKSHHGVTGAGALTLRWRARFLHNLIPCRSLRIGDVFAVERNFGQDMLDFRNLGQNMVDCLSGKDSGAAESKELTAARICLILVKLWLI